MRTYISASSLYLILYSVSCTARSFSNVPSPTGRYRTAVASCVSLHDDLSAAIARRLLKDVLTGNAVNHAGVLRFQPFYGNLIRYLRLFPVYDCR